MLVLSRNVGQRILIGDDITLTILRNIGGRVRLGIEAPKDVNIVRTELLQPERIAAAGTTTSEPERTLQR